MSERGYFYIAGGFSSNIELSGKTFSSSGKNDAFLSKLSTSSLSEVDYFLLQFDQLDQIHTVSNHSRNEILLSGRSHSSILTSSDIYSNNDHALISLRFPMDSVVGGKFTDFHPVGVGQPFKFDFITFGVDEGRDFFEIDKIDLPSWASVKMVDSNNGYLFGNAPAEEGNFPIKLNFKLTGLEAVTLQENLVIKNGKPTPDINSKISSIRAVYHF